jgi:hypothetical protein
MNENSDLIAFVFADRAGDALEPLTDSTCVALLPVAGKPKVEALLGDGTRLGVQLSYALTRGQEAPEELLWRYCDELPPSFLAVRGDVLRSRCIAEFLDTARELPLSSAYGHIAGGPCGLCLAADTQPVRHLGWSDSARKSAPLGAKVSLEDAAYSVIDSLGAYYRANLMVASGRFKGLVLPGRSEDTNLAIGPASEVEPDSLVVGRAVIGERCRIHPDARLNGPVVIGDDAFVIRSRCDRFDSKSRARVGRAS